MRFRWLMVGLAWLQLGALADAKPDRSPQLERLKRLHAELTIDYPLDRMKLERLRAAALEDDLILDAFEQALLESFVSKGYQDPTQESAPEIDATFEGKPPQGWVARSQKLLVSALHASLMSRAGAQALRELTAIAWRDDLTSADRQQILTLIDHYRLVDSKQQTQDAMEGLSVLVTNPKEARSDREHQRQLEVLSQLANRPVIHWSPSASSSR